MSKLVCVMGWMYADSISLNEKNHQVEMMNIIYGNASRVCIWLGEATDSSRMALSFIKNEVLYLQSFDTLCDSKDASKKWVALLDLMQRPWFSRRWVVQELALAREPIIYCGNDRISWKKFAIAVELFVEVETATHRLSEVMRKDRQDQYIPSYFDYVSALGASLLVDATERLFRDWKKVEVSQPETLTDAQAESATDSDSDDESVASEDSDSSTPPKTHNVSKDSSNRIQPLLSLEYLVSSLTIFDTTVPHDTIYALLAIAKDTTPRAVSTRALVTSRSAQEGLEIYTQRKSYNVNYKLPYVDVCKDFIQFAIERSLDGSASRALDVICRPWAIEERKLQKNRDAKLKKQEKERKAEKREKARKARRQNDRAHSSRSQSEDSSPVDEVSTESASAQAEAADDDDVSLPSWVPQLSNAPFAMDQRPGTSGPKMSRINADPLVGLPSSTHRNYSAAETKGVDMKTLRFRKRPAAKQFSMYVRGFQLDVIKEVAQVARNGQIPIEWADLAEWKDAEKFPPDTFWQTLVANRGKDGKNPPVYYSRACQESFRKGGLGSGAIDTTALIEYERNSVVAQFCRRVQAVTWNRALVRTKGEKLGLVGKDVQKGDRVCILYGCSVPVVLRECPRKTEDEFKTEMEQELVDIRNTVVRTLQQYIRRKRQHQAWKDKEMAKLCRKWLKTTGYMRSHGFDPTRPSVENPRGLLLRILGQAISDFKTCCSKEREKNWPEIESRIEAEVKERKENPNKKLSRPGKREMDEHVRRQTDKQAMEKHEAEARSLRKRRQSRSAADMPEFTSGVLTIVGGAGSAVSKEAPVAVKGKATSVDWWEFEYALVAGRRWKQVIRQRREAREAALRRRLLDEYEALKKKNARKGSNNTIEVPASSGTGVRQEFVAQNERAVKWEHTTIQRRTSVEERAIGDENNNDHGNGPLRDQEDNDGSAKPEADTETGKYEDKGKEEDANGGDHASQDSLPLDAGPSHSVSPAARGPIDSRRFRPSWRHAVNKTELTSAEIQDYDEKIRKNLRERLGEEGYFSYTLLGECYVHGMMDGEAMQYQNEDVEGVMPSMVFEIR
jgi:hypothetical protein